MRNTLGENQRVIGGILRIVGLTIGIAGLLIRQGQSSDVENTPPELSAIRATVPNASGDLANLGIAIWDTPLMRGAAVAMMLGGLVCFGVGYWLHGGSSEAS